MEEISNPQIENDRKLGFISDKNNTSTIILNTDTYSYLNIKATQKMIHIIKHIEINFN